jgi:hypothetical protein
MRGKISFVEHYTLLSTRASNSKITTLKVFEGGAQI